MRLNFYEYLRLKNTGFVEERGNKYYIKKIGNQCPFQHGNLCILQNKNKPKACRLFPFIILKRGEKEAFYEFDGEKFFVYVELGCPNIELGEPMNIEALVEEAIRIYLGKQKMPLLQYHPQLEYPHCLQTLQPSS